jgi:ABC-type iron transport system FetAB permease component
MMLPINDWLVTLGLNRLMETLSRQRHPQNTGLAISLRRWAASCEVIRKAIRVNMIATTNLMVVVELTKEAVRHQIVIRIMTTSTAALDVVAMLLLGHLGVFSCDSLLRLDGMRTIR